mgnify:CR=1 FL=1
MKVVERNRYNDKGEVFQKRVLTFEPFKYDQIESVVEIIQNNFDFKISKTYQSALDFSIKESKLTSAIIFLL